MTEIEKKLIILNGIQNEMYPSQVEKLIRRRYSLSAELAILRQRDTKPAEFEEYNNYVEACKADVKAELGIGGEAE